MKIDVAYMAKDGRRFSSAKECEKYEKRLGTEAGTVARARIDLKELGEKSYVFGLLKVRHGGENYYRTYATRCIDDKLAEPNEWIKACPSFDAKTEYRKI